MALKVTNNASTTIAGSINAAATAINLAGGTGSLFPVLSGSDWFWGTLVDASNNIEVVKVTARSTDALTVTRGQDGTTAKSYTVGDRFELRPTAALFNDKADKDNPTFTTGITSPAITLGATALTATGAELNYMAGVTSAIQTQLDAKAPLASPTFTGTVDLSATVLKGAAPIAFDGATAGTNKTSVAVTDPTANRTITVPDADVDLTKVRAASTTLDGVSRFGTNAEQLAGSLSTVGCTPAGLASSQSIALTGYRKCPGGLIEQWGLVGVDLDIPSGGLVFNITFPITFPIAAYSITVTPYTFDSGGIRNIAVIQNGTPTTSGASCYAFEGAGGVQASWGVFYQVNGK